MESTVKRDLYSAMGIKTNPNDLTHSSSSKSHPPPPSKIRPLIASEDQSSSIQMNPHETTTALSPVRSPTPRSPDEKSKIGPQLEKSGEVLINQSTDNENDDNSNATRNDAGPTADVTNSNRQGVPQRDALKTNEFKLVPIPTLATPNNGVPPSRGSDPALTPSLSAAGFTFGRSDAHISDQLRLDMKIRNSDIQFRRVKTSNGTPMIVPVRTSSYYYCRNIYIMFLS